MGDFLAVAAPRGIVGAAEEVNDLSPLPPPIRGSRNDLCSRASRNSNEEFLPAFHPANEAGSILAQFPQSDCLHPSNCSTYATDESPIAETLGGWIVDAMNVIGSRPDGWWRNRQAAMVALVHDLERWAATQRQQVTVVFEPLRRRRPQIR